MRGQDSRFLKGAFTLTVAGLLVKVMGALYRIPLYSILGSEGMGLFQMAYPIYSILFTVSSAGLNVAISKAVAERWALGRRRDARRAFACSFVLAAVLGALGWALLYSLSGTIAAGMGKDPRAALSVAAISPAVLVAALLSALRGWFQGIEEMTVPAISQVLEQLGKILTTLTLASFFMAKGIEYAAAGATFGAVAGAFVAVVFTGGAYLVQKRHWAHSARQDFAREDSGRGKRESWTSIALNIAAIAVPISLASAVFGITELIDLGLVPGRLQAAGYSREEATMLFGRLTGAAFPLINIPTMFTGALQMTLVPSVTVALAVGDREKVKRQIDKALSIALMLALPAALGLYVLSEPILLLLFHDEGVGQILRSVTPAVFFLALQQVSSGILQGMGRAKVPLYSLLWAVAVKAPLSYILVAIPSLGVVGAGLATSAYFAVAALLNLRAIDKDLGYSIGGLTLLKTAFAGAVMAFGAGGVYRILSNIIAWEMATALAIVAGVIVYVTMVFVLGLASWDDLQLIPGVKRITGRLTKRRKP